MPEIYTLGLLLVIVAGIVQGGFAVPMKFMKRWKWEHLWLLYSLVAMFILPFLTAVFTVPHLREIFGSLDPGLIAMTAAFGAGWGIGSVCFGLGLDALGMALGFSIMAGMYTALGALIPVLVLRPEMLWTQGGMLLVLGNVVMILGVIICAVAGGHRDRMMREKAGPAGLNPKMSFAAGLAICVAAGVFSPMFNFAFAFGTPISAKAMEFGATTNSAINAIWLVALPAGGIINAGYCLYLLQKRRSWDLLYRGVHPRDWISGVVMGLLWTGSVILYGWGANTMGPLGASLGWSVWNASVIITTLVVGLLMQEWKGVSGRPLSLLFTGIGVLIVSIVILGIGGAGG